MQLWVRFANNTRFINDRALSRAFTTTTIAHSCDSTMIAGACKSTQQRARASLIQMYGLGGNFFLLIIAATRPTCNRDSNYFAHLPVNFPKPHTHSLMSRNCRKQTGSRLLQLFLIARTWSRRCNCLHCWSFVITLKERSAVIKSTERPRRINQRRRVVGQWSEEVPLIHLVLTICLDRNWFSSGSCLSLALLCSTTT